MSGNTATLQIEIKVGGDGTVQLGQINRALGQVDAAARQSAQGLGTASQGLGQLKAASVAFLAIEMAKKVAEWGKEYLYLADNMSVLSAKMGLVTGSAAEQQAVQQQLYAMSQETRTAISANADAFFSYSNAMASTGASSKDVLEVVDLVTKSLKVSGATAAESSSFTLQFGQALSSGVLQGDEFRAMVESNSVFARELAKSLDTDIAGLLAMSSAGELTTAKLAEDFPAMAQNINASFEQIPPTIEGALTTVQNVFAMVLGGANDATGGTQFLAEEISGLAVTVQANAPAIQALFSGIVVLADSAVRSISGVVGVIQTLASSATTATAYVVDKLSVAADYYGVTENAVMNVKAATDAARESAVDLAGKAIGSFTQMVQSTANAKKEQEEYRKSIAGSSEQVLKDIDAQKKREQEHSGSVDRMTKAEANAAGERAKILDDMYKAIGGEAYYQHEAEKALAHVEVLKKAGATEEEQARYTYGKIAELSEQAWKKGETAAGEYLDQIKSSMADAVGVTQQSSAAYADAITKAWKDARVGSDEYFSVQSEKLQKEKDEIAAATGNNLLAEQWYYSELSKLSHETGQSVVGDLSAITDAAQTLGGVSPVISVDADTNSALENMSSAQSAAEQLNSSTAIVSVDADTSNFNSKMNAVESRVEHIKGQFGVNTKDAGELRAAIEMLNRTPTLDPFGDTRKRYRELIDEINRNQGASSVTTSSQPTGVGSYTGGSYFSGFSGGGYTGDAPRSGGIDGEGGYLAILHPQETVIDHTAPDKAAIGSLFSQFAVPQTQAANSFTGQFAVPQINLMAPAQAMRDAMPQMPQLQAASSFTGQFAMPQINLMAPVQ
ncbi:tape measure protein, partial [Candidatus Electronema sp. JM]|uniref:tape measure protein n=1 Tax=Candidatus Electronema sp. JM TaxID=3401571 RepID=UPI003AA80B78